MAFYYLAANVYLMDKVSYMIHFPIIRLIAKTKRYLVIIYGIRAWASLNPTKAEFEIERCFYVK